MRLRLSTAAYQTTPMILASNELANLYKFYRGFLHQNNTERPFKY